MSGTGGVGVWQGHARDSREYRRILMALACAGVATFAQLYSPQGILPEIATTLRVTPDRSALLISAATIGLAAGVLPWSWLADRVGRLPAMNASLIAATVLGFAVVVCPSFPGILVLRALEGIALGGLPALAMTYLQEEIHPAHAAVAAGTYVSGTSIGGLLGRIVAAPIGSWLGWRWGVGTVVVLSALAAVGFMLLTPAPRGFQRMPAAQRDSLPRLVWAKLREPALLVLYAQGFLLMGGFVTIYNYLAFRLTAAPFHLSTTVTSLLFLAYLAGTWSSRRAGAAAGRYGRLGVLLVSIGVMIAGILLTLVPALPFVLAGLVVLTIGFFAAHAIASGWTAARAVVGRAQATSLYNLFYYLGSSVVGWLGGLVFTRFGWDATALTVVCLAVVAAAWAGDRRAAALTARPRRRSRRPPVARLCQGGIMTADNVVQLRRAVTVAVVHDDPFEVLMVRRPPRGTFPHALVFPGGSLDPGETVEQAAVRETFEETQVDISGVPLVRFGHWITPASSPRRFDTHFLLAHLDHTPEPVVNAGELVEVFWIAPAEAIRREAEREDLVVFPTLAHLALLDAAGGGAAALDAARDRAITVVQPEMRTEDDGTVIGAIPADAGYPITQWVNWTVAPR